jgi:Zn-dependent M28 family amino/carboxypeptidase
MRPRFSAVIPFAAILILAAGLAAAPKKSTPATKPTDASAEAAQLQPAAAKAMEAIDPEKIKADVKELSADAYEGRGTGQKGGDKAADYIAKKFASYGLKPAGDNGTFLQKVAMVGIATEPSSTLQLVPNSGQPIDLKQGTDVVAMDESQQPTSDVDADIVFVGYGIEAPEYKWDDYKGTDVKGKVLLMLVNEPPSEDQSFFKGKALTYYGRWTYKYEEAARKGAVGAIIIHNTDMASYGWNVVETSWGGERSYLRGDGKPKLKLASWITGDVAQKIASAMNTTVQDMIKQGASRDFKPVPVPFKVKAHMVSKVRPFDSANVVGMVPGSDPKLKNEGVIYSAHYDHLGIHADASGDNIYNGAIDNGTGCGILLEMARAFASSPVKPKRSIYFASVTAEEQGLRGSEYLGQKPPIPAGKITLGLNYDALAPIGIPEEVEITGAERNTFYPVVEATAKDFGLKIMPDSNPGAGHYYRSDHFSFSRVGIPAFSISEGEKFEGHDRAYGDEWQKNYTAHDYHQPSDEYKADWDFRGLAKMTRFGFVLGWKAAEQPELVQWQHGDEFEAARKGGSH